MKKRNILLLMSFLLGSMSPAAAQTDTDYDDEIIVQDANGQEEIFEVPEGMTLDIDSLLTDYNAQNYLSNDDGCNFTNENPTFDKEVYVDRLKRLPTAMEMPWNEVVQKFIDQYSGRLRRSVSFMLGAQNFYMPMFEQALEVYGLPLELKYLPCIESALKPRATSRVGATGLWQFILSTGKRYGLRVNTMIDERCDPLKASYAAAHYLSDLYKIYGDWNLVLAAYNYGPENINKAIHRAGGEKDYWKIYPYLPSETRGYVPAFIAANYIMTYYCEHNICPMRTTIPAQTDTLMLYRDVHFKQISDVLGISMDQLRALNPQYRKDIVTGYSEPTDLRLPVEYINQFIDKENEIFAYDVSNLMKRTEVEVADVKSTSRSRRNSRTAKKKQQEEAANSLAQNNADDKADEAKTESKNANGVKAEKLADNAKVNNDYEEDDEEEVTTKSSRRRDNSRSSRNSRNDRKSKKKKKERQPSSITIKNGDNLISIAKRNHTTVEKLQKLNGIKGENIRAGEKLKVR